MGSFFILLSLRNLFLEPKEKLDGWIGEGKEGQNGYMLDKDRGKWLAGLEEGSLPLVDDVCYILMKCYYQMYSPLSVILHWWYMT